MSKVVPQYAARDHLPEWMLAKAAAAKEVWAASPYVTDTRLFQAAKKGGNMRLYTDFSSISFISGASSLKVLKELLYSNVEIYHAECLHAKVVLIDATWFSVGSQNLTKRGRNKNLEASFVSGEAATPTDVLALFGHLHEHATRITLAGILAMEAFVAPWLSKFKNISDVAAGIDVQVEAVEQEKRAAADLAFQRMRRARRKLKRFLNETQPTPTNQLVAAVRKIYNPLSEPMWVGLGKESRESLVPANPGQNFETLFVGLGIRPRRLHRYLVVNEDTGQLGLVRFSKTTWTFFANGILCRETVYLGGQELKVEIEFDWKPVKESQRNGVAFLRSIDNDDAGAVVATVDFTFTATGVELGEFECTEVNPDLAARLTSQPEQAEREKLALKKQIFSQVTIPFMFKQKKIGREADQFLGTRSKFTVTIHRLGAQVIFSLRKAS